MKKIFALMTAFAMLLALSACGGGSANTSGGDSGAVQENSEPAGEAGGEESGGETGGETGGEETAGGGTHIYVLTAAEDHGWTGSVATFAKAKAAEVNDGGVYTAEVITSRSSGDQITQLEDIIALIGARYIPLGAYRAHPCCRVCFGFIPIQSKNL